MIVAVPYHLDEALEEFDTGVPVDRVVRADLPSGSPWHRMSVLYEQVAGVVADVTATRSAGAAPPVVVSGDCTTSLAVLAGLQRAGRDPGVVWFDAHADFHTEASTTSGYLGGMPLALAVGVGTSTLTDALGLRPVASSRAVLVDARDTDPGEHALLAGTSVRRTSVPGLAVPGRAARDLPDGDLYLHVDADVCDPDRVPGLLFPAPGGPDPASLVAAVRSIAATGRVAAVGIGATWRHRDPVAPEHAELVRGLVAAVAG